MEHQHHIRPAPFAPMSDESFRSPPQPWPRTRLRDHEVEEGRGHEVEEEGREICITCVRTSSQCENVRFPFSMRVFVFPLPKHSAPSCV
eukprot:4152555-Alexandrium_andersonii.AAC.1